MSAERGILLVPDLALEKWPSMDRYANALASRLAPQVSVPQEWRTLGGSRYVARYLRYPRALARYQPAAVHVADHSYAHCLKAFRGIPSAVTVHDLYPLHVLKQSSRSPRALLRDALLSRSVRWISEADLIIADNAFVAGEVTELLGIPQERVRLGGLGVDQMFFQNRPRLPIPHSPFTVLHVGSCVPRKNIEAVIATLAELRTRGVRAVLLQVGGHFTAEQRVLIAKLGVSGLIMQEPSVDDARLVQAYGEADVLLFPSHYEGFGLPVLEALAAGMPVVTSGAGGLREAGGDVATVVSEPNASRLADAVQAAFAAPADPRRQAWARKFSWEAVADAHRRVYDELLKRP